MSEKNVVKISETNCNKWKEFEQKAALHGRSFHRAQCSVTLTSREHCSRLQQSRCHAVIEDRMILLLRMSQQTPSAFQWPDNPQNCPLPWGCRPPQSHSTWLLGPTRVKRHLYRFSHFSTAHTCDQQTHRPRYVRHM